MKKEPIIIELSSYVKPHIEETMHKDWVLNGKNNHFFQYIIDRYNGSPTNSALIDAYVDRIYGKGISIVNSEKNASEYAALLSILPKKELKKVVSDFVLFGSSVGQVRYAASKKRRIAKIEHLDRVSVAPNRIKNGEVPGYWVCDNWGNTNKYTPKYYPTFGTSNKKTEIFEIKPYKSGKTYFADPRYLAALQYAKLEEEIANFSVNHIKNGLSAGFIINFNDGDPGEEVQEDIERKVINKLTGSNNAGKVIISFNDNKETAPSIEEIPSNANHEQWQFWANEARQQILVGHRVTTPMLFGVKDNTGLGNNANEMKEGSKLLHETTIRPSQNEILDVLEEIVQVNEIASPLTFIPLEDAEEDEQEMDEKGEIVQKKVKEEKVEMSSQNLETGADFLINLGEDINDDWESIEERGVESHSLSEDKLNTIIQLASVPKGDARKTSEQDTSLFKIRYKYVGNPTPERPFCSKLMKANKVYRYEDLKAAEDMVVNSGFGVKGADTYSIFLYKGGVNCKHWWSRTIYLKKGNKKIGVNEAKKMILELDPIDRKAAKWKENPKEVAQIASDENNNWRYTLSKKINAVLAGFNPNQKRAKDGKWEDGDSKKSESQKETKDTDYRMQHQIGWEEGYHSTLDDLTNGDASPSDIYDRHNDYMWGNGDDYKESWAAISKAKGNPEATITIYRAVPKYVNKINNGDWISLSPTYAKQHSWDLMGKGKDGKVISVDVKVKDIIWDGNDMNEFGFLESNLR